MNKLLCATLIAASLAAPAAYADQPVYMGAAVGLTGGNATLSDGTTILESTNSPRPFRINAGYEITPAFAFEAGYVDATDFTFVGTPHFGHSLMYLALKGQLPLGEKWGVSGKLGVARHDLDISGLGANSTSIKNNLAMLSVGASYRFTQQISATLDLVDYGSSNKGGFKLRARQIELGLQYNY